MICYENIVKVEVFFFFFSKWNLWWFCFVDVCNCLSLDDKLQILVSKFFVLSVLSANRITPMLTPWILNKVPFSCHFSFSYIMGLKISLSISMIYKTINKGVQNTLSLRMMLSMNQWGEMEDDKGNFVVLTKLSILGESDGPNELVSFACTFTA